MIRLHCPPHAVYWNLNLASSFRILKAYLTLFQKMENQSILVGVQLDATSLHDDHVVSPPL